VTRRLVRLGLVAALAAIPLLNLLPGAHPPHASDFLVGVVGKWLPYAILARARDHASG